jgi:GTP-binding protein YchF
MAQLSCGIVGLPNVGKSTLFNALTANLAPASNYPFCTIDPNIGIVEVYDPRLSILSKLSKSQRIIYATTQFVDIAGLVEGASQGEGLGNKFLANIRETDAILHVVRCFESPDIVHVSGKVDPIRDIGVINTELMLADLQMVENSLLKIEKQLKSKRDLQPLFDLLVTIKDHLNKGFLASSLDLTPEELELIRPYPLLTRKKILYVANITEADLPGMSNPLVEEVKAYAKKEGNVVIPICARLEEEVAQLPKEEQASFLESLGLKQSGLQRLIASSYEMLGLISFLTTGEMETRAWTIPQGTLAADAAGEIHTDIKKGFIRAEVVAYEDMVAYGGRSGAREMGKIRAEGRDYIVRDGDVIIFLHN